MYVRRSKRRLIYRIGLLLLAVIVLAPKFEVPSMTQFTAFLNSVALEQPSVGQSAPSA